jgi:hypothetical protein
MLPDTLQRRLESIPDLSKQGKRINGLSRLMAEPLLWEQAYTEIASNRGALTPGVTDETLDGFSRERVAGIIKQIRNGTITRFEDLKFSKCFSSVAIDGSMSSKHEAMTFCSILVAMSNVAR